jgi:hypothetical protein
MQWNYSFSSSQRRIDTPHGAVVVATNTDSINMGAFAESSAVARTQQTDSSCNSGCLVYPGAMRAKLYTSIDTLFTHWDNGFGGWHTSITIPIEKISTTAPELWCCGAEIPKIVDEVCEKPTNIVTLALAYETCIANVMSRCTPNGLTYRNNEEESQRKLLESLSYAANMLGIAGDSSLGVMGIGNNPYINTLVTQGYSSREELLTILINAIGLMNSQTGMMGTDGSLGKFVLALPPSVFTHVTMGNLTNIQSTVLAMLQSSGCASCNADNSYFDLQVLKVPELQTLQPYGRPVGLLYDTSTIEWIRPHFDQNGQPNNGAGGSPYAILPAMGNGLTMHRVGISRVGSLVTQDLNRVIRILF